VSEWVLCWWSKKKPNDDKWVSCQKGL
jgi:hypothetical protein